jgi:hypothetical protein
MDRGRKWDNNWPIIVTIVFVVAAAGFFWESSSSASQESDLEANQLVGAALLVHQTSQLAGHVTPVLREDSHRPESLIVGRPLDGALADELGLAAPQPPHRGFFLRPEGPDANWFINRSFRLSQDGEDWFALVLPGVKKQLCQSLNAMLHEDDLNTEPVRSVYAKEQWIGGYIVLNDVDLRLSRREGCASALGGEYIFYMLMISR